MTINDVHYSRALELTSLLLGTTLSSQMSGSGTMWRWEELTRLWELNADVLGCRVFFAALHHLFWGVYPGSVTSEDLKKLLTIIEVNLLSNGNAYRAWKSRTAYRKAFRCVAESDRCAEQTGGPSLHSRTTGRYLSSRLYYRVVYKGQTPSAINLVTASYREINNSRTRTKITAFVRGYELVMKRLLPEAVEWTYEQWSDDRVLFDAMRKRYGVNFDNRSDDFDAIIDFLMAEWAYGSDNTLGKVVNIPGMPLSIAKVIWPGDIVEQTVKMFRTAHSRAKAVEHRAHCDRSGRPLTHKTTFSYQNLKASWLYKQIMAWINDGTFSGPDFKGVRESALNLALGV